MAHTTRFLLACLAMLALSGCSNLFLDLGDIPLGDMDTALDQGPADDGGDTPDMDMSAPPEDMDTPPEDMDMGEVEPDMTEEDMGLPFGECDPVMQTGCQMNENCTLVAVKPPPEPEFRTRCQVTEGNTGMVMKGETCTMNEECAPDVFCINWSGTPFQGTLGRSCSAYCYVGQDPSGCEASEECFERFDGANGIGFCVPE